MKPQVKICGLSTPETMTAAIEAGADFVGLVFHAPSPRHVEIEVAAYLANYVPQNIKICGLFVNPDDQKLHEALENVRLDIVQLHGHETLERVAAIKAMVGRPVIKALSVANKEDLSVMKEYEQVCDWLLLDAPPLSCQREKKPFGGAGVIFDWQILKGFSTTMPWMLAGGLTPDNVKTAINTAKPDAVDVSSGVESTRGIKDCAKIKAFIEAVRSAE